MDIVLDIGNTNRKVALLHGGQLVELGQFRELGPDILRDVFARYPDIRRGILASVLPGNDEIIAWLEQRIRMVVMDHQTPLPIANRYLTPDTLGPDRIAAATAGWSVCPGDPVLVINAGTCITYDFVNSEGAYLGGSISPGLNMRLRALHTFTGKLPLIDLRREAELTGADTAGAILSGVLNGAIAETDGITALYAARYPGLQVIISGGDMNYFTGRLKISTFALPNIVIHGLQKILEFNVHQDP